MQRIKQALIIASLATGMLSALPAAAMMDMDGKPIKIDSLVGKGQWTAVEIWASDCEMCRATIHEFLDFEVANPKVRVLGISVDGAGGEEAANEFIDQQGLTFTNLISDPPEMDKYLQDKLKESFIGTPTVLLYDPQGKLVTSQPGGATAADLAKYITGKSAVAAKAEPAQP